MSPFLQTEGTAEGVFFDPETMEPKMSKPIFKDAMQIYKRLVLASPFASIGPTSWLANNGFFDEGRCGLTFNFPGPVKMIISNQKGGVAFNLTGKLDVVKLPGVACSDLPDTACPHNDKGVNFAPNFAGGGASGCIRASTEKDKKDAIFDFFSWLSDPEIGYLVVANPGTLLDPFRASHVNGLENADSKTARAFLAQGWEPRQLEPLQ